MASPKSPQRRPMTVRVLHDTQSSWTAVSKGVSMQDEVLQHSRYIRDYLAPLLADEPTLPPGEMALLSSVMNRISAVPMTLELLRYSRIEKALMVMAYTAQECWPADLIKVSDLEVQQVLRAERLLKKWEDELGVDMESVHQDLFRVGGRLEGLKLHELAIGEREFEIKDRVWWSSTPIETLRPFEMGHSGFEVGSWYINPCAAHLAGMIGNPTLSVTSSTPKLATALLLTNKSEELLYPFDGTRLTYHHTPHEPNATSLCQTLNSDTPKHVRVLRSYKLQSPLAPKAGVRYDGLYLVQGYGLKLTPPNEWAYSFHLERVVEDQPPLWTALSIPTSDQLDDWQDYLRMLVAMHGADVAGLNTLDVESDALTTASTRTTSLDSGYDTLPRPSSSVGTTTLHPVPSDSVIELSPDRSLRPTLSRTAALEPDKGRYGGSAGVSKVEEEKKSTDKPTSPAKQQANKSQQQTEEAVPVEPVLKKRDSLTQQQQQKRLSLVQRRGTVSISDVVMGGEIETAKREKATGEKGGEKAREKGKKAGELGGSASAFLRLGRKWGL